MTLYFNKYKDTGSGDDEEGGSSSSSGQGYGTTATDGEEETDDDNGSEDDEEEKEGEDEKEVEEVYVGEEDDVVEEDEEMEEDDEMEMEVEEDEKEVEEEEGEEDEEDDEAIPGDESSGSWKCGGTSSSEYYPCYEHAPGMSIISSSDVNMQSLTSGRTGCSSASGAGRVSIVSGVIATESDYSSIRDRDNSPVSPSRHHRRRPQNYFLQYYSDVYRHTGSDSDTAYCSDVGDYVSPQRLEIDSFAHYYSDGCEVHSASSSSDEEEDDDDDESDDDSYYQDRLYTYNTDGEEEDGEGGSSGTERRHSDTEIIYGGVDYDSDWSDYYSVTRQRSYCSCSSNGHSTSDSGAEYTDSSQRNNNYITSVVNGDDTFQTNESDVQLKDFYINGDMEIDVENSN